MGGAGEERTAGGVVGHAENGEAIGALDVEDVTVLRVGDVGVVVSWDLVEYLLRYGAGVGGGGAELRQHHRSTRHQSIQYPHLLVEEEEEGKLMELNWSE